MACEFRDANSSHFERQPEGGYRFVLLFFNCMLTFGSYFCFDMPSVLQDTFTGVSNCTGNSTDKNGTIQNDTNCNKCEGCLGMSDDDYNLLYAIYAWTNAAVVIGAGFLIDKLGNRGRSEEEIRYITAKFFGVRKFRNNMVLNFLSLMSTSIFMLTCPFGVFLFSFLCVLGSSTFAVGAMLKGSSALLPVMLIGRLLFGSGNGSLTIVQNRITAYWFKNKELALAFGITLAFSRLGSVLNFLLTQNVEARVGLTWTLWGGAMLCGLGFLSAIVVSFLDIHGVKQLGDTENLKIESKKVRVTDVKYFSISYWLLALTIMFFYNGVFPFVADSTKFIIKKYASSLDKSTASYISGSVYDVSMVLSPFLGGVIDIIGKRGYLALSCSLATIPVFGILAFTDWYPLIATLWLGITYSFAAASMWPSIPLVVSQATVGTAMGLTTSIQMIGIGVSNLIVGQILGDDKHESNETILNNWKYVMIFLLANSLACCATSTILNIVDKRRGGILNLSRRQKQAAQSMIDHSQGSVSDSGRAVTYESSDDETDPLISKDKSAIN